MRPQEYLATEADLWTEAVELRNAILDGMAKAQDEGKGFAALNHQDVGQAG